MPSRKVRLLRVLRTHRGSDQTAGLTQLRHRRMGQSHAQKRGRYQLPCIVDMMPCSEFEYP
jgi:hypothetical protein